jgi:L-ascorbate metabolism protein UlaG (beta-lactamase superfamily)
MRARKQIQQGIAMGMERASRSYYLREDVYVDPMVNNWFAWPNLLAPATYAMYLTKTHKRLMKSFIKDHQLHVMANQDPELAGGGEFVDCPGSQVADVAQLLARIDSDCGIYTQFAEAIRSLDALIKSHKSGESMEPLYEKVPDLLKGYVELYMDLYHQPAYRLIEGLLYRSGLYKEQFQAVSFGVLSRVKARPFVLSTPRIADGNHLHVRAPFRSPLWDTIFNARSQPVSADRIEQMFADAELSGGLAPMDLFTETPPRTAHDPVESGVRVRYVGHAGLLVEGGGVAILVDPVIACRNQDNEAQTYSFSDLPPYIDYVCITHNHADHLSIESLLQLRHKIGTILVPKNNGGTLADPSLKLILKTIGFNVAEVDDMEEVVAGDARIVALPFLGEHGDLNIRSKTAWFFDVEGRRIYAGADSSNLEPRMYQHIHAITGDLDVLAIGMECVGAPYTWVYGALTTEAVPKNMRESRRLNGADFAKAAKMIETLRPQSVLVYALGMEPWYGYFTGLSYTENSEQIVQSTRLVEHCESLGIPIKRLNGKHELLLAAAREALRVDVPRQGRSPETPRLARQPDPDTTGA